MAVIENRFVCDLSKPVQAQALKGNVFSLDNLGSRISVLIYDNGQPATISGSITANCILPDGSTVNVNGGLTTEGGGSKAYVDVPQSCLLIPGILKIAIKCTSSSVITTLAAIVANVYMTKTDNVITPSQQIITDWNAQISAAIATQNAAIANQDTKIDDLESTLSGYGYFEYSLPSGSNVGKYWNNYYNANIPSGTKILFKFYGYIGSKFSRIVVGGVKSDNSTTVITTIYNNTPTELTINTTETYKALYTQLVRSEAESPVSYSISIKADIGSMLGHDIVNLKETTDNNTYDVDYLQKSFDELVYSHLNLFDFCTFTDGYVYNSSGAMVAASGVSVATPIRVSANVPVYLKNVRCYFSYFIYDDGTNSGRIAGNDSTHSGSFTPTKDGYAYLTVSTTNKTVCVCTFDATLYNGDRTGSYFKPNKLEGVQHAFTVEKDGSGDFDSLVDAIDEAEKYFDAVVYVGAGVWDIIEELGEDYVQSVSSSKRGIVLKNRIHLIFSSEALVTCIYEGINGVIKDDTVSWLAPFNAGEYGFTLENCRIQSKNVRYSVHDEMGLTNTTPYHNRYINCQMSHSNQKYDPNQGAHGFAQCIGGGLGTDGYIQITGCVFENPYQYSADIQGRKVLVSYHTQNSSNASRSQIEISGCYFKDAGTCRGTYISTNTDVSTMLVHDNSFGKEPFVGPESASAETVNIEMLTWNNEVRVS